ncbi:hypothetical protein EAP58_13530 [Salmonella enterica]|nr:hypothetical protein [Salmonella enterica]
MFIVFSVEIAYFLFDTERHFHRMQEKKRSLYFCHCYPPSAAVFLSPVAFYRLPFTVYSFRRLAFLITHSHFSARDISQPVSGWWLFAW